MSSLKSLMLFSITLLTLPTLANAQAVPQVKTQSGYYRLMLGQFEVTALSDGTSTLPMDKLLARTPADIITQRLKDDDLNASAVETSFNAFLINTGQNLVLVDTGYGKKSDAPVGRLLSHLKAAGYRPDQVDTVILTHLHGDHIGGLLTDGKPTFPNAAVYISKADRDFWLSEANLQKAPAERKGMFQLAQNTFHVINAAKKLKTFSGSQEIVPGVTSLPLAGHTPGHTGVWVDSEDAKLLVWGDTIHAAAVQFPLPATTISFDSDMDAAAKTRASIMADAAEKNYWVASAHINFPGLGHVKVQKGDDGKPIGYRWVPANYSLSGLAAQ
ncbi:MBL fold metallo-hydrolase [Lonsdalea populi]|uniref:MBL fold metallo-hydrolase n=1 Tax=Lonsdalea populi TaxID=1172565 RepID=A0A3N0UQT4_9GAMM|nr:MULTISPECIES: MBL fold metallo-hydrolase [Lonsdalea]RAT16927.1 MBL fold metallo-hydrolase [Lonsdalea quercina]RAT29012.1 MBL fold metallo-hydrolase [Lonsdalea populi]RAT34499.1 MBL fold metallo-hydrolase [Lonsdalea populi]RAT48247.1 MBL fold metallo-hydrolase [Lonsdalea populi]RAT51944.1 MBL fold metallo-hydrolase [Lonsdalea populi]